MNEKIVTQSTLTKQQYEAYTKVAQKNLYYYDWFSYLVGGIVLLVLLFITRGTNTDFYNKLMIAPVIIMLVALSGFIREKNAKQLWETNTKMHDLVSTYEFTEEEVTQTNEFSSYSVTYPEIKKMIEYDEYLFLMFSKSQGFVLEKEKCSQELLNLLDQNISKKVKY